MTFLSMLENNNPVLKTEIWFSGNSDTQFFTDTYCVKLLNIKGLWNQLLSLSCIFLVKILLQKILALAVKAVIKILFVKQFAFILATNLVLTLGISALMVYFG